VMLGFLTYAGLPAYGIQETATSELQFEWVPGEGEGKVDHVPFEALPKQMVTYDSATKSFIAGDGSQLTPEAQKLFAEFQADVDHWRELDRPFAEQGGQAKLTITPWVMNAQGEVELEKVTLVINVGGKEQPALVRFISRHKENPAQ
jgi:ubiquinol-cytochrome c reductase cytochrome b subunit